MGETPARTAGKDEQASSVTRAGGGDRQRPRKPDRRCFKPRPLLRAECAGFASSCRSDFLESFGFSLQAAGGPLVPLPTDRHTATGTCEIGHNRNNIFFGLCKRISSLHQKTFLTYCFRVCSRRVQLRAVNGSMRCALRTNCAMMAMPQSTNSPSRNSLPDAAEVEQSGERPRTGEGGAEHLGANQDGGADHSDDVKPNDTAAFGHEGLPCEAAMSLNPAAGSSP